MSKARILHYIDTGTGPTVVLLHGFLASSVYWQRVIDTLSAKHRVIAIDLLGFGDSPKPACSRYDYSAQLESIQATIDHARIDGKFTLIGHSMGSLLSLRYASLHEDNVEKLVLANMPVFLSSKEARRDIMGGNFLYQIGLRRGLHDVIWPIFMALTYLRLLPQHVAEGAVNRRLFVFKSRGYSRLRSMRNVIFAATIEADLLRLNIATVIVSGLQDRKQYLQNLPKLRAAKNIANKTVQGGHHLPITNPELLSSLV